jgi:hypothetical protein
MLKSCRLMEAKRSDRSHFSGSGIDIIDAWDLAYHGSLWIPDQGFCRASCGCCVVCWLQFPARTRRDVNVGKAEKLPHAKIRAPFPRPSPPFLSPANRTILTVQFCFNSHLLSPHIFRVCQKF